MVCFKVRIRIGINFYFLVMFWENVCVVFIVNLCFNFIFFVEYWIYNLIDNFGFCCICRLYGGMWRKWFVCINEFFYLGLILCICIRCIIKVVSMY